MPFAQDHYPFDNQAIFQEHFPADFIVEYTGQLRGWFYYLHLLSVALFGAPAFKNVVVHGVMIGNDGRKMSKSFSNYPDPRPTIEKYGAEALRLDFMSSKIMRGEDTKISEPDIQEASRLIKILHHVLGYFVLYAPPGDRRPSSDFVPKSILDRWIVSRLQQTINLIDRGLTDFNFVAAAGAIRPFVEDLSTWYIRRNRDRFVKGEEEVVATMSFVLEKFALAIAPILPFSAEYIWRSLGSESSVHLADFPSVDEGAVTRSADLMTKMGVIRELASVSHQRRAEANLPLRQPLAKLFLSGCDWLNSELEWRDILIDEVNVKEVVFSSGPLDDIDESWTPVAGGALRLDTKLTSELLAEGRKRELIRLVQDARKKAGAQQGQLVDVSYFTTDKELASIVKESAVTLGRELNIRQFRAFDSAGELSEVATGFFISVRLLD